LPATSSFRGPVAQPGLTSGKRVGLLLTGESRRSGVQIPAGPPHIFLVVFVVSGFLMKFLSELSHELGHGVFVLLYGGRIIQIYVSLLWPYEQSYIRWSLPTGLGPEAMAWIYAGGIVVNLLLSFSIQAFLLKRKLSWKFSSPLVWLSFWCYVNSTGYLLVGGFRPFGDVAELIRLGVLTAFSSLILGITLFFTGFIFLSQILLRLFTAFFTRRTAKFAVNIFWVQIPVLVALAASRVGAFAFLLTAGFIPVVFSLVLEHLIRK